MRRTLACVSSISIAVLGVCGCSVMGPSPPDVPGVIKAPADQEVFLEALASGSQVYECVPKSGQAGAYEWTFRAPEAQLTSRLSAATSASTTPGRCGRHPTAAACSAR